MLQTDGGYLGSDFEAFFSAVVSGAAGVYVGVLLQDAGIETDLVVRPGQRVSVSGDPSLPRPPRWGRRRLHGAAARLFDTAICCC